MLSGQTGILPFIHFDTMEKDAISMNTHKHNIIITMLALGIQAFSVLPASAGTTTYNDGDVFLGLRATSGTGVTKDYLVNIGPASQFRDGPSKTLILGNIGADLATVFGSDWYTRQDSNNGTNAVLYGIIGTQAFAGNGDPDNTNYVSNVSITPWDRDFNSSQSFTSGLIDAMRFAYFGQTWSVNSNVALIQDASSDNSYASYEPGGNNSQGISFQTYDPTIEAAPNERLYLDRLIPATSHDFGPGAVVGFFTLSSSGQLAFNFGTAPPPPVPVPAQLLNISSRLRVQIGENVLIGGFIAAGADPKKVLIRALGPSLANAGIQDYLPDPTLELHDWLASAQKADIQASGLAPTNSRESAIIATLTPNQGYTAIVRGKGFATGIALVEVFDLAPTANSKLANISTRGFVQVGANVLIGGIIVGNGSTDGKAIVRAIGPSLAAVGVTNPLADPTLALHDSNGALLAYNDNWQDDPSQAAQIQASGLAPKNALESAIVRTLPPGNYTAIVAGKNGGTGVALVEAYDLN